MDVMHYFAGLVRFLIRQGQLVDSGPEIMAAQLCLDQPLRPEPEREADVMQLIHRHIRRFLGAFQRRDSL